MNRQVIKLFFIVLIVNLGFLSALPSSERLTDGQPRNNISMKIEQVIEGDGFPVEVHHVVTTDGYILEMHRIPRGRGQAGPDDEPRIPVFLMHGLSGASDSFVAIGSELSVGYNIADAGFDVWIGNARGNKDSRAHVTLDPDDSVEKFAFFDFTWEEIGMIDIPTMIDYVLDVTGHKKLHYIGHSQGGTVFLVLNSMRPEYNDKFLSAHLLAGVGYMEHFPDEALANLAQQTDIIYAYALEIGLVELFPPNFTLPEVPGPYPAGGFPIPRTALDCFTTTAYEAMCDVMGLRKGTDTGDLDIEEILENFGGAAAKQFAHYGQNVRDKLFRRWNFGTAGNLEAYGTEEPPLFDISLVTVNVTMHYTVGDDLLDERDVLAMARDMPSTVARRVARDSFSHTDFVMSSDARELVTNYIVDAFVAIRDAESGDDNENIDENSPGSSNMISLSLLLQLFTVISCLKLIK